MRFDPNPTEAEPWAGLDVRHLGRRAPAHPEPPSECASTYAGSAPLHWRCALASAAGLHGLLNLALKAFEVQVDEPTPLRWLRLVDEHPLRCTLATALLGLGVELAWRARPRPHRVDPVDPSSSEPFARSASPPAWASNDPQDGPQATRSSSGDEARAPGAELNSR